MNSNFNFLKACLEDKIRAEEESKTVVSTFYPNQIEEGWNCTYTIYAPDIEQRILIGSKIEFCKCLKANSCEV